MSTRKIIVAPIIEVKKFTIPEIDVGIRKLRRRIEEVNGLSDSKIEHGDAKVKVAESNIREAVREVFGQNSPEFNDHEYHTIWDGGYGMYDDEYEMQRKFLAGIPQTVGILEGLIARLEEKRVDLAEYGEPTPHGSISHPATGASLTKKVFVVHGNDEEAKQTVARFLEKLRLEAVVLSERPNEGRTIIEKFETNSDVGFAIVLPQLRDKPPKNRQKPSKKG